MGKKTVGIFLLLALILGIGLKIGLERGVRIEDGKTGHIQKIRVVMDDNYPPYVFRNEEGELKGILIDYWELWEKKPASRQRLLPKIGMKP